MNVVATDRKIAMLKTASDPGHRKALETQKSHFKIGFFKLSNHQNLDYFHMKITFLQSSKNHMWFCQNLLLGQKLDFNIVQCDRARIRSSKTSETLGII